MLFLLIEPGARAVAMGESYVAVADDATAGYFNPASLVGQSRKKMHFTHSKWLPGLADDLFLRVFGLFYADRRWRHWL